MRRGHVHITVDMEEWFHSNWFDVPKVIQEHYHGEYPRTDIVETTQELIETFDKFDVKATFFLLGESAEKYPQLFKILSATEHEIGCHGWYHNKDYSNLEEFEKDILKFKSEISSDLKGFRFPHFNYSIENLKFLLKEGFTYDSSIVPCLSIPGWYGNPKSPIKPYSLNLGNGTSITEFPLSVFPYLRLPGAGGWFLRNAGYLWTKNVVKFSLRTSGYGMIYIHPWEISDSRPNIKDVSFHVFRNAGKKTLNNIKNLIKEFSEHEFLTLSENPILKKAVK